MTNAEAFKKYLDSVIASIKSDAAGKGQKIPQDFRVEVSEELGVLFGASHFKYLVHGRGPGKFPPPDAMLKIVDDNPSMLADAKVRWRNITAKGLAYIIGRRISLSGTRIFRGLKPGVDFVGSLQKNKPELLKMLVHNEAVKVQMMIRQAARVLVVALFLFSSCAGSKFATKQNELAYRHKSGQRLVVLNNDHKLRKK